MATLKSKEIKKMSKTELNSKLKELKVELVKTKASPGKKGQKIKEIKKIIARIHSTNIQK